MSILDVVESLQTQLNETQQKLGEKQKELEEKNNTIHKLRARLNIVAKADTEDAEKKFPFSESIMAKFKAIFTSGSFRPAKIYLKEYENRVEILKKITVFCFVVADQPIQKELKILKASLIPKDKLRLFILLNLQERYQDPTLFNVDRATKLVRQEMKKQIPDYLQWNKKTLLAVKKFIRSVLELCWLVLLSDNLAEANHYLTLIT